MWPARIARTLTAADNPWTCAAFRRTARQSCRRRTGGQFNEAHEVGRPLLRVNPSFSAAQFAAGHTFKDADKRRLFGDHLMLAGLPE
jgi:hypothetical protein